MSHGGREERSRKTRAERKTETVVRRRRAPFRNGFDPSVRQFCSNFLPLLQNTCRREESKWRVVRGTKVLYISTVIIKAAVRGAEIGLRVMQSHETL